eukprot:2237336-Rhodomonas_salina.2
MAWCISVGKRQASALRLERHPSDTKYAGKAHLFAQKSQILHHRNAELGVHHWKIAARKRPNSPGQTLPELNRSKTLGFCLPSSSASPEHAVTVWIQVARLSESDSECHQDDDDGGDQESRAEMNSSQRTGAYLSSFMLAKYCRSPLMRGVFISI